MRSLRIICPFLVVFSLSASAQSVFVPLDHQVYPLLVKGETLGLFDSYRLRVLPATRTEILKLLREMSQKKENFSFADRGLLDQMLEEFTDPAIGEPATDESEPHLYRYEEGRTQIFLDSRGVEEIRVNSGRVGMEDETISETIAAGYLRASFGDHVFVGASARTSMLVGKKNPESHFDPAQGLPQVAVGKSVFTDQATGYVGVDYSMFHLFAGRMNLGWGSGLQEQLGVSTLNEPMDMVRFSLDFSRFRFSYFHANLQGLGQGRYLAAHRLDVLFGKNIQGGFYETVVYAHRGAQLSYLNPFVPYNIIEHQQGDLDNKAVGADISAIIVPGVRVYGELFVDDFSINKSITEYWGNKLAYNIGCHWAKPMDIEPVELFATYTRVDPFVFTHYDSLNVYTHYDASIGAKLGPNADRYSLGIAYQPHRDLRAEVSYFSTRHGTGTIAGPFRPADGYSKNFLTGTIETQTSIDLRVRYQLYRYIFASVEAQLTDHQNVNLVSGLNANENFFRVSLDVNYY
jgi:hypothetical protein